MSEKIKITCPRCGHEWETTLEELENIETVYREIYKKVDEAKTKVLKYRAKCPVDGTYIVIEVQED